MQTNKLTFAAIVAASLISTSGFAKEEISKHHRFGLNIANIDVDQTYGSVDYLGSDRANFVGLSYAYNIKIAQDFFVEPNVTFYLSDMDIKDTDGTDDKSTLSNISSYLIDFGYSQNKLSYYGTLGLTAANYKRTVSGLSSSKASDSALTYGLGIAYDITDSVVLDLEYQTTDLSYEVVNSNSNFEIGLDVIKLGIAYKF
jgi:opacity protein-like surface antigen